MADMTTTVAANEGFHVGINVLRNDDTLVFDGYISFNVNGTQVRNISLREQYTHHTRSIHFTTTTYGEYSIGLDIPGYVLDRIRFNGVTSNNLNIGRISRHSVIIIFVVPDTASPSGGSPNLDTASAWAHEGINSAVAAGLVPAHIQNHYSNRITRGDFTALAVSLYETVTGREITGRVQFNDTDCINIQKAAYIGIVTGTGHGNFSPNMAFNREQASLILTRLMTALGHPLPPAEPTFADNSTIASWSIESVGKVQAAGIMGGVGNNTFNPHGLFTREQSIVTILRIFDMVS